MSAQKNPSTESDKERQVIGGFDEPLVNDQRDTDPMEPEKPAMRSPIGTAGIYHAQDLSDEVVDPLLGQIVGGHYQIISRLGAGGMSVVYLARHALLSCQVALKIISPDRLLEPKSMKRFEHEARAAIHMNHPHIAKTTEFGLDDLGRPYIVMEYIEGTSLYQMLHTWGTISPRQAVSIMVQACDALEHAHRKGVIHRDIKPANIIVTKRHEVKLVDFGIAKMRSGDLSQSQSLTATGEIFGSPLYMSPEQCAGGELDQRSDIYSLGCVLYEALNGDPPFRGGTALQTLSHHVKTPPPRFYREGIPANLEAATMKALEKDPAKRFQTMDEFSEALTTSSPVERMHSIGRVLGAVRHLQESDQDKTWWYGFVTGLIILVLGFAFSAGYNFRLRQDVAAPMAKERDWNFLMYKAEQAILSEDYPGAERLFSQAASTAENLSNNEKLLETLQELEKVYQVEGKAADVERTQVWEKSLPR